MKRNEICANPSNLRGVKIKLYPTEDQKKILFRQIELFRWVYNWMLELEIDALNTTGLFISHSDVERQFQQLRKENEWLMELPLGSAREALNQCDKAWDSFFKHKTRKPKFKSKKISKLKQAFHFRNEDYAFYFSNGYVKIPGFKGRGDMVECKTIPYDMTARKYKCGVIYDGFDFWLTLNIEVDRSYLKENAVYSGETIGIDVGVRNFAYLSNGKVYKTPNFRRLLKRRNRNISRLAKMRNRRVAKSMQARTKLENIPMTKNEQKLHKSQHKLLQRISNIKKTYVHTITTEIANTYPSKIVIETLDIKRMMKRKYHKGKDMIFPEVYVMWAKFRDYLQYKCEERGIELIMANTTFPSSQLCSNCGSKGILNAHTFKCPCCGFTTDRDYNASLNLSHYTV